MHYSRSETTRELFDKNVERKLYGNLSVHYNNSHATQKLDGTNDYAKLAHSNCSKFFDSESVHTWLSQWNLNRPLMNFSGHVVEMVGICPIDKSIHVHIKFVLRLTLQSSVPKVRLKTKHCQIIAIISQAQAHRRAKRVRMKNIRISSSSSLEKVWDSNRCCSKKPVVVDWEVVISAAVN